MPGIIISSRNVELMKQKQNLALSMYVFIKHMLSRKWQNIQKMVRMGVRPLWVPFSEFSWHNEQQVIKFKKQNIALNRWSGDQSSHARTESPGRWEPGRDAVCQMDRGGHSQRIFVLVLCDVRAYVSCRGYAGISQSARADRESRWHRGNDLKLPSLTE